MLPTRRFRRSIWRSFAVCALAFTLATVSAPLLAAAHTPVAVAGAPLDVSAQSAAAGTAFRLLMGQFIHPVPSSELLGAAWANLAADAAAAGVASPGPVPQFTDNQTADEATFSRAFTAYLGRLGVIPPSFSPSRSVIQGMVADLGEAHTYALGPEQYASFQAWTNGQADRYVGIGVTVAKADEGTAVLRVLPGGPADRAGVMPGDIITSVNGVSLRGISPQQSAGLVRGAAGTSVDLTLLRGTIATPINVAVIREEIEVAFVSQRMMAGDIGYVALASFPDPSVVTRLQAAIAQLTELGARGLILDLRGNPGGNVVAGTRILEHFLPSGSPLYRQVSREGAQITHSARAATRWLQPLVVLVDRGSASMSEIFASAIQENGGGTIVGTQTAGAVAAAQVFPLGDGTALQVTVSEILSGNGEILNGVGIQPDQLVDGSHLQPGADDPAIALAVDDLHQSLLQGASSPAALLAPSGG